jgi:glycosyltransferase involved in cell wall biosynthesis
MQLSVVIITFNEESNIGRTLQSVQPLVADGKGEIIVVDSGSTDRTVEIAKSFGAQVFVEEWKGYATQKNSAIDKATGKWVLSLDADEEVEPSLLEELTIRTGQSSHLLIDSTDAKANALDDESTRKSELLLRRDERIFGGTKESLPRTVDQAWRLLARSQA